MFRLFSNKEIKYNKQITFLIIIAAIGVLVLLISPLNMQSTSLETTSENLQPTQNVIGQNNENMNMSDYETLYEEELKELILTIPGVSAVTVSVNLDSSEEIVIEKNIRTTGNETNEKDNNGGTRVQKEQSLDEQVVIIKNKDGDKPIILKTIKPKVRGVVVVAKGAENMQVKKWITEAVQRLLDVPLHRIAIIPKK